MLDTLLLPYVNCIKHVTLPCRTWRSLCRHSVHTILDRTASTGYPDHRQTESCGRSGRQPTRLLDPCPLPQQPSGLPARLRWWSEPAPPAACRRMPCTSCSRLVASCSTKCTTQLANFFALKTNNVRCSLLILPQYNVIKRDDRRDG